MTTTFDYTKTAATAKRLLSRFGAQGKIAYKQRSGDYDPTTGDYPETEVMQDVTAVVFPIDKKLVDGVTVLATDEQAYLSTVGLVTPQPTHKLVWMADIYTIVSVKNTAPAGVAVLCELIVRR